MPTQLDDHGQPRAWINASRRCDRAVTEMLGFARGLVADGVVNSAEVEGLGRWIQKNPDACGAFPGKDLYQRLVRIFADGRIDDDEREELRLFLEDVTADDVHGRTAPRPKASALPLDTPPPHLSFEGSRFVVTGRFVYGPRKMVAMQLGSYGALVEDDVTLRTDVLLVGSLASRDWIQSPFGRKIERAVALRAERRQPAIVSEEHWVASL